jgi:recombination protein RecA
VGAIKNGEDVTGNRTAVKVVKNKLAPPFTKVEFDLMYGEGISEEGDILDLAATADFVEKSGAWYSYKGERMGQGRDQAKQFLKEHPEVKVELRSRLLAAKGIGQLLMTQPEGEAEEVNESVDADGASIVSKDEAKSAKGKKSIKH